MYCLKKYLVILRNVWSPWSSPRLGPGAGRWPRWSCWPQPWWRGSIFCTKIFTMKWSSWNDVYCQFLDQILPSALSSVCRSSSHHTGKRTCCSHAPATWKLWHYFRLCDTMWHYFSFSLSRTSWTVLVLPNLTRGTAWGRPGRPPPGTPWGRPAPARPGQSGSASRSEKY